MCITKQNGWIEIICGSMFSGKSEELIRRVRRATYGHLNVQVFKPSIDDRYANESIVSHSGSSTIAHPIKSPENILNDLDKGIDIIGIDEIQFFDETVIAVVEELAYQGIRVIVSGLDLNFRGEPFGPMPHLMTLAESVTKLNAICPVCGCPASRTQRLINGEPASYYDPTILVGDSEAYEARCRHHHEVPNKPGRRPKDKFTKMMKRSRT